MVAKDFLPIGSIVKLKEYKKKLMITGILQYIKDRPEQRYDYLGVLYPEGDIGSQFRLTFNHSDIQEVVFRGYEDETREKFIKKVESLIGEKNEV
ncbi:DUF4176 domain-containing protein [Holdemania massiliensis]|uniref:DUF4176 domain-containing protein n=1 Tax=Holdemania massiliensis TaxID=1468449 RepID=UPI00059287A0|nr:DUF4176 domain-containing protein [Holdemania massiliensis]